MFNDAAEGKSSGYRVYTVDRIDQERNRVYLKDFQASFHHTTIVARANRQEGKARAPSFKPKDWESWDAEKKKTWSRYNDMYMKPAKSVQLSNVSLLVQENKQDPS